MEQQDLELKWKQNVALAREVSGTKKINQMRVAELALEVCEISWGGAKFRNLYTLRRFAKEVGVPERRLGSWVAVRKAVYDKLPKGERDAVTYTKLSQVAKNVEMEAPKEEVAKAFTKMVHRDPFDSKMLRCLADLRGISYNFLVHNAAAKLNDATIEEYLFYLEQCLELIKKEKPNLKAKENNLAARNRIGYHSAAAALGVKRNSPAWNEKVKVKDGHSELTITPKDRDVANFLKQRKGFLTPTEIGMKLGGHNANSATAWACRSLNKLQSIGAVERNEKGHYRWSGLGESAD